MTAIPVPIMRRQHVDVDALIRDSLASLPIRWHPPSPLTRDRCERCGLLLFEDERVEHTGTFTVRDDDPLLGGIGGITATYCTEHAPKEATR